MLTCYREICPYLTKDGSEIRELMHPAIHGNVNQSLAEALVPAGCRTLLHRHPLSEELYHVTAGSGTMTLDGQHFPIQAGDTVLIPPGSAHCVEAGEDGLRILCCCSPPYRHDDTELLE